MLSDINQYIPHENEWKDFLDNSKNKSQLINLLVDYVLGDDFSTNKEIYNGNTCYHKKLDGPSSQRNELFSTYKEAYQKAVFHAPCLKVKKVKMFALLQMAPMFTSCYYLLVTSL